MMGLFKAVFTHLDSILDKIPKVSITISSDPVSTPFDWPMILATVGGAFLAAIATFISVLLTIKHEAKTRKEDRIQEVSPSLSYNLQEIPKELRDCKAISSEIRRVDYGEIGEVEFSKRSNLLEFWIFIENCGLGSAINPFLSYIRCNDIIYRCEVESNIAVKVGDAFYLNVRLAAFDYDDPVYQIYFCYFDVYRNLYEQKIHIEPIPYPNGEKGFAGAKLTYVFNPEIQPGRHPRTILD